MKVPTVFVAKVNYYLYKSFVPGSTSSAKVHVSIGDRIVLLNRFGDRGRFGVFFVRGVVCFDLINAVTDDGLCYEDGTKNEKR